MMRPDIGYSHYDSFQDALPAYVRDRYWGVTNKLLLASEKHDAEGEKIQQLGDLPQVIKLGTALKERRISEGRARLGELFTQAEHLNAVADADPQNAFNAIDARNALMLSILLAHANVKKSFRHLPGVNVRLYAFKQDEVAHPYSANRVEMTITKADSGQAVVMQSNLLTLRDHLRIATQSQQITAKTVAEELINKDPEKEGPDKFVEQRTTELLEVRGETKIAGDGESQAELLELKRSLCNDMIEVALQQRRTPEFLSEYTLKIGTQVRGVRNQPVILRVENVSGAAKKVDFTVAQPNAGEWSDEERRFVRLMRTVDGRYDFFDGTARAYIAKK